MRLGAGEWVEDGGGLAFTPLVLLGAGADQGAWNPAAPHATLHWVAGDEAVLSRVWLGLPGLLRKWPQHRLARAAWWQQYGLLVSPARSGSNAHLSSCPGYICVREMCRAVMCHLEGRAEEVQWHRAVLRLRTTEDRITLKIVHPLPALNSTGWCHTSVPQAGRGAEISVCVGTSSFPVFIPVMHCGPSGATAG